LDCLINRIVLADGQRLFFPLIDVFLGFFHDHFGHYADFSVRVALHRSPLLLADDGGRPVKVNAYPSFHAVSSAAQKGRGALLFLLLQLLFDRLALFELALLVSAREPHPLGAGRPVGGHGAGL
jgi:hypothetical protein